MILVINCLVCKYFRFYKFVGNLYYFNEDKKRYSWYESHAACTTMFLTPGTTGHSGNLASLETTAEFNFIV